jgi:hypothetical protein
MTDINQLVEEALSDAQKRFVKYEKETKKGGKVGAVLGAATGAGLGILGNKMRGEPIDVRHAMIGAAAGGGFGGLVGKNYSSDEGKKKYFGLKS